MTLSEISSRLFFFGLVPLGHCRKGNDTLVLIGPDEPAFWGQFTTSPEYRDKQPNPLDRWSERVLSSVAKEMDAEPLFPFGGPPYHPFHTWALETGRFWSSPVGFLVHETAGLFVSFRGALLLPEVWPDAHGTRPCDSCPDQPCKSACPVGAFQDGYDVAACKAHLHRPEGTDCMVKGCRSRRACPIGRSRRLPAQAAFHMEAFR